MLQCSSCPNEFVQGQVCDKCSKLFCAEHKLDSCAFCGGKLRHVHNEVEKYGEIEINWLAIDDNLQVGTVGLNSLPAYTMEILSNIRLSNSQLRVILFDSKERSIKFEKAFCQKHERLYQKKAVHERSRYSFLFLEEPNLYYLLLNLNSINDRTAIFLTMLNIQILAEVKHNREVLEKKEQIITSIGNVLFEYNKKMNIPFISADEMISTLVTNLVTNVQQDYIEASALRKLLENRNYSNDVGEFIKYKIDTAISVMDFDSRFFIAEVFQTLEKFLHINILLASISSNAYLMRFLENSFDRTFDLFKKKYSELPDLIRAATYICENQSQIVFSTYDKFAGSISSIIQNAFSEIEARYVSLAEAVSLIKLSDYYLTGLANGEFVFVPNIGTIHGYFELLKKVFKKEGIYPEIRIVAGYALEHSLLSWLMMDPTSSLFHEYVKHTKELALLIETSLPEILKKNGPIGNFRGSSLTYDDAAQKLLAASKIAKSFGDTKIEKEFGQIAERMARKYDLLSIKIMLWWAKFVETQNFSYLNKIHESMSGQTSKTLYGLNYLAVPIDLLAKSVLFREQIDHNIERAQEILLNFAAVGVTLEVDAKASLRTDLGFYHIFDMFRELLKYQGKIEDIKKAYSSALALTEVLLPADPLMIFSLKTRIIYHVLNNNMEPALDLCKKLSSYPDTEGCIRQFLNITMKWIEICSKKEERKYIYQYEFQYNGKDVWILILQSFIRRSMEDDLSKNIAGSKAAVFVEGITDILVLKAFRDKIRANERIYFFDMEGFANYQYYAESKVVKELKMPVYLIFDGDTRQEKRKKVIQILKRRSITANHVYTLQKNSIENYLLNPQSISRAYPKKELDEEIIQEFFEKTKNKKNKKRVLQLLFEQFNLGSYNEKTAELIASKTEVNEIDPEIKQLLKKIIALESF